LTRSQKYLTLAKSIALTFSKDPSTKVGVVIVRPDNTVASVGYNGFPKGYLDLPEEYLDRDYKVAHIVHAEANAITHARENLSGSTIYVWPLMPCRECMKLIAASGIKKVVFLQNNDLLNKSKNQWNANDAFTIAKKANIEIISIEI
jgi:dCMP deaminase